LESCLSREIQAEEGETKDFELAYQQMINIYQLYFIVLLMVGASDAYDVCPQDAQSQPSWLHCIRWIRCWCLSMTMPSAKRQLMTGGVASVHLASRLEQRHRSEKLQRALTFTDPGSKNSAALEASLPGNPGRVWWVGFKVSKSSKSSKSKRVSLCMND